MTLRDQIIHDALALPPEDRVFVVAALEQSLGATNTENLPDEVAEGSPAAISGEEFLRELQRRSEAYRSGATTARPAADVLADQRRKQAAEVPR